MPLSALRPGRAADATNMKALLLLFPLFFSRAVACATTDDPTSLSLGLTSADLRVLLLKRSHDTGFPRTCDSAGVVRFQPPVDAAKDDYDIAALVFDDHDAPFKTLEDRLTFGQQQLHALRANAMITISGADPGLHKYLVWRQGALPTSRSAEPVELHFSECPSPGSPSPSQNGQTPQDAQSGPPPQDAQSAPPPGAQSGGLTLARVAAWDQDQDQAQAQDQDSKSKSKLTVSAFNHRCPAPFTLVFRRGSEEGKVRTSRHIALINVSELSRSNANPIEVSVSSSEKRQVCVSVQDMPTPQHAGNRKDAQKWLAAAVVLAALAVFLSVGLIVWCSLAEKEPEWQESVEFGERWTR